MALLLFDPGLVFEACGFAAMKHRDQRRRDAHRSPYINHPIETARLLASVGGVTDATILAAAVLHDVLEETAAAPRDIERFFGADVRRLVEAVTDTPDLPKNERRRQQLERARTASAGARLIRLADKIAALSSMPHDWDAGERRQYLEWMGAMAAVLKGTNAHLESLLAVRLRQAWAQTHTPPPSLVPPTPALPHIGPVRESSADLAKAIARLQSQLSSAEELADSIVLMLAALGISVVRPNRRGTATTVSGPDEPRPRPHRFADPRVRKLAEPGVGTLDMREIDDHTVAVSLDGAPEFELTRTLAALLRILAGAGRGVDGFPPFLPYPAIAAMLRAVTGRPAGVRAVVVGISRLRERLQADGCVSPLLVESQRGHGARFRIRRAEP